MSRRTGEQANRQRCPDTGRSVQRGTRIAISRLVWNTYARRSRRDVRHYTYRRRPESEIGGRPAQSAAKTPGGAIPRLERCKPTAIPMLRRDWIAVPSCPMLQLFQTVANCESATGSFKVLAFLPPRPDIDIRYEKYDHDTTIPWCHGAGTRCRLRARRRPVRTALFLRQLLTRVSPPPSSAQDI